MTTNENNQWVELAHLPITKMQDVLLARFVGREEAMKQGFSPEMITRLATVISEITRNVIQHAGAPGEVKLGRVSAGEKAGLRVIVSDGGRGMEHPERHVAGDSASSAGAGLPGARRLVSSLSIQSAPGVGTVVTMDMWKS
jgi:serine/threonine-protein kinase RsbT